MPRNRKTKGRIVSIVKFSDEIKRTVNMPKKYAPTEKGMDSFANLKIDMFK